MPAERFESAAARAMRDAIRHAGAVEIFAVGEIGDKRQVVSIEVHARGTADAVLALRDRPRSGQVVIHNHPSGVLLPSNADMEMAGRFGEDGVGFVIVDNLLERAQWVVEPTRRALIPVEAAQIERVFNQALPGLLPGWEPRPGQLGMALRIGELLTEGGPALLEAGTGTGKSLAYLVPAALWALANDRKVMVSTYTRTLQGQLVSSDLPLLRQLVPAARTAVLKGRNNYVCKRKLELVSDESPLLDTLRAWAASSPDGDREGLGIDLDDELWERVESDVDQTLRARCPHFNTCFYYQARRRAAAAHITVVNHALLLADLSIKSVADASGILPTFDRVILDEAHHLEQAATSISEVRLSIRGLQRAAGPLLPARRRRAGALETISRRWPELMAGSSEAAMALTRMRDVASMGFSSLADTVHQPLRVREAPPSPEFFGELSEELTTVAARLGALEHKLEELVQGESPDARSPVRGEDLQALLDLARARRRLEEGASAARNFLDADPDACRYLDPGPAGVTAARAPVDVAPTLRRLLVDQLEAAILTSATLAVQGRVDHYLERTGLEGAPFLSYPSPFRYAEQAILALPKDLPVPDAPGWAEVVGGVLVRAVRASRGGVFVLCTSHAAVQIFADRLESEVGRQHAILRQGKGARSRLLDRFRDDAGAVLVGTDSFWEGVSVRGDGLRQVIIPRLPFRVPTEPVAEARYERITQSGRDAFRVWSLPEAVIKLRQGFGRLIRSGVDRGAVMVLDRRLHDRWYGRVFLGSLPDARRLVGPTEMVIRELESFFRAWTPPTPP